MRLLGPRWDQPSSRLRWHSGTWCRASPEEVKGEDLARTGRQRPVALDLDRAGFGPHPRPVPVHGMAASETGEESRAEPALVDRPDGRTGEEHQTPDAVLTLLLDDLIVSAGPAEVGWQDFLQDVQEVGLYEHHPLAAQLLEAANLGEVDVEADGALGAATGPLLQAAVVAT